MKRLVVLEPFLISNLNNKTFSIPNAPVLPTVIHRLETYTEILDRPAHMRSPTHDRGYQRDQIEMWKDNDLSLVIQIMHR